MEVNTMQYSALLHQAEIKSARIKEILAKENPTPEEVDEAAALSDEIKSLEQQAAELKSQICPEHHLQGENVMNNEVKTIGEIFTESPAFKSYHEHRAINADSVVPIDVKTTMSTSAGWAPFVQRTPTVGTYPTAPNSLLDILPVINVNLGGAIKYMVETTFTNAATGVAEAGAYPEAAIALTEKTASLRKIAVWLPVTEEQLSDVAGLQDYLNSRLAAMLVERVGKQLFHGDGTAPNCDGLDSWSFTNSVNASSYTNPIDAIAKAIQNVRSNGMTDPTHIVMSPAAWYNLTVSKASTAGVYLWGDPRIAGLPTLFGIPIIVAPAFSPTSSGKASVYVGDFTKYMFLAAAPEMTFAITDSHASLFASGTYAVRAAMRVNLGVYREKAFCKITNIAIA
jgi:HK97 family phage major capsid protein